MNIGLDIDNVITEFDKSIIREFLIEDKNKRNSGIINKKSSHINKGMFDWTEEEVNEFYKNNMERIAKNLKPKYACKKYMDKLLSDGHELYLISHRAYPHYIEPEKTTLDWLIKHKINYTKLILSNSPDKTEECKKYKIDIMVDDRASQCEIMQSKGVNCILMLTKLNFKEAQNLKFAKSWKNLYEEITQWKKEM